MVAVTVLIIALGIALFFYIKDHNSREQERIKKIRDATHNNVDPSDKGGTRR